MYAMGVVLAISGFAMVALGVIILGAAVVKLVNEAFLKAGTSTTEAPVNLPDLSKLIEALVKLPQWLLAIIAGDVQIWIATRLMSNLPWWP